MSERRPTEFALIVGAMKSGTTSLFELLCQHPEIAGCSRKEPSYFSREEAPREGWNEYLEMWDWDPGRHRIALEASTSYAKAPWVEGVPERIAATSGASFRFLYIMRDPVERMASQIRHSLFEGWGQSLDEGLADAVLDFSRYAMQIDRYTRAFPRDSILLLTLEDLRHEPDDVLRRACDFLGVSPGWTFEGQNEARNRGDFYQVPEVVAWLARRRPVQAVVETLPSPVHRGLRRAVSTLGSDRSDSLGRWKLNQEERDEVLQRLSGDLRRLRDVYGVDVERRWSLPPSLLAS